MNFYRSNCSSTPSQFPIPPHRSHSRHFQGSKYVYPVVSRRSKGISVGINLSPNNTCNFNCIYCQVNRSGDTPSNGAISLKTLQAELQQVLTLIQTGDIFNFTPFDNTPKHLRRLNDIALSGNGEPTASACFFDACRICVDARNSFQTQQLGLAGQPENIKIVLITNASLLHRLAVRKGLDLLDDSRDQIWAKLDAGRESYFKKINQSAIPFQQILDNITLTSQARPITIQSLFMRIDGNPTDTDEITAYTDRLIDILAKNGKIAAIQLHTIARTPRDSSVSALSDAELDEIAQQISQRISVNIEKYYA